MRRFLLLLLSLAFLLAPTPSQSKSQIKREIKKLERSARRDVNKLGEALRLAQKHEMKAEVRRIAGKMVKLDKDNEAAHAALGQVRHQGKWMSAAAAEKLLAAALEKANKAKGLVKVDGAWVKQEHAADAKLGIFRFDGELVNRYELGQLQLGKKRHPATGRLIDAADFAKADKDQFRVGGKWVGMDEANEAHKELSNPWVVRSHFAWIVSTLDLDTIRNKVSPQVDAAYRKLQTVFGGIEAQQTRRPIVVILRNKEQFQQYGEDFGGAGSAYGAFLSENMKMKIDGAEGRVGVSHWDKSWGPYWARHAAGLAMSYSFVGEPLSELPKWFPRALGGYVERFSERSHAKFFGAQHAKKKWSVSEVADWMASFEISGDNEQRRNDFNVYQAGLCLHFAMFGGDLQTTNALQAVTKALSARQNPGPAVARFGTALGKRGKEIAAHFAKLTR